MNFFYGRARYNVAAICPTLESEGCNFATWPRGRFGTGGGTLTITKEVVLAELNFGRPRAN
jgi:hypothetical protein